MPVELGGGLELREVRPEDHALLCAWIDADPHHRGKTLPSFFEAAKDCFLLHDEHAPVFFLKLSRAVRLDVQFAPGDRIRTRRGLHEGFPPLAAILAATGAEEVLFAADTELLARSMEKRMGFKRSPHELVRSLRKA